jgi:hypothetical protein
MPKYKPITMPESDYCEATESYLGFCRLCHSEHENCEPDARHYKCHCCKFMEVFGAEELLTMGLIEFTEDDD